MIALVDMLWGVGTISIMVTLCLAALGSKKHRYYIGGGISTILATASLAVFSMLSFPIDPILPISSRLVPALPGLVLAALVCFILRDRAHTDGSKQ